MRPSPRIRVSSHPRFKGPQTAPLILTELACRESRQRALDTACWEKRRIATLIPAVMASPEAPRPPVAPAYLALAARRWPGAPPTGDIDKSSHPTGFVDAATTPTT